MKIEIDTDNPPSWDTARELTCALLKQELAFACEMANRPRNEAWVKKEYSDRAQNLRRVLVDLGALDKTCTLKDRPEDCTCDSTVGEWHPCPYEEEINGDHAPRCDCCPACMQHCCDEI